MSALTDTPTTLEKELDRLRVHLTGLKTATELLADADRLTHEVKTGNSEVLTAYRELLLQTGGTYAGEIATARTALTNHLTEHQQGWDAQLAAAKHAVGQTERQLAGLQERVEELLVSDLAGETAILSGEVRQMQQQHEQKLKELTNLLHRAHEGVQVTKEKLDRLLTDGSSRQDSLQEAIAETTKHLNPLAAAVAKLDKQLSGLPTENTVVRLLDERVKTNREERTTALAKLQADLLRLTDEQTAARLTEIATDLKTHFDGQQKNMTDSLAALRQQLADQQRNIRWQLWLMAFIGLALGAIAAIGSWVHP